MQEEFDNSLFTESRKSFASKKYTIEKRFLIFLFLFIVIYAIYSPVTKGYFLYVDDYGYVFQKDLSQVSRELSLGRPGYAFFDILVKNFVNNIETANIARFIGIIGLALLCFVSYLWFEIYHLNRSDAFFLSILVSTIAPFHLLVSWLTGIPNIYAALISAVSALMAFKAVNQQKIIKGVIFCFVATGLFILAIGTYQPAAMFYWVMLAIAVTRLEIQEWKLGRRTLFYCFLIGFISLAVYLVLYKIIAPLILGIHLVDRANLLEPCDIIAKIYWFISIPTINALNFFTPFPSLLIILLVIAVILGGFILELLQIFKKGVNKKKLFWNYLQKYFLILCLIPLSFLPMLIVKENNIGYRVLSAYAALMVILFYNGFKRIQDFLPNQQKSFLTYLFVLLVLKAAYTANDVVIRYFVLPQSMEIRYLKSQLQQHYTPDIENIYIIRPRWYAPLAKHTRPDIGIYSSSEPSMPVGMVKAALNELGIKRGNINITSGTKGGEPKTSYDREGLPLPKDDKKTLIIDMTKLEYSR